MAIPKQKPLYHGAVHKSADSGQSAKTRNGNAMLTGAKKATIRIEQPRQRSGSFELRRTVDVRRAVTPIVMYVTNKHEV
jgi:hypothetical protein